MSDISQELLAQLNAGIMKYQLTPIDEEIRKNATTCVSLVAIGEDDYSSIGNTRLGGDPDLPNNFGWPREQHSKQTRYLNFIAQINFAELPRNAPIELPSTGILYIFIRYAVQMYNYFSNVTYFGVTYSCHSHSA